MAVIDDVKKALRISHTSLDSLITQQIAMARAEMIRNGMDTAVANSESNLLVLDAIIAFCQMRNADTIAEMEAYEKSWKYQLDCLRKSTWDTDSDTDSSESGGD